MMWSTLASSAVMGSPHRAQMPSCFSHSLRRMFLTRWRPVLRPLFLRLIPFRFLRALLWQPVEQ
jgi:hypothetical protein